MSGSFYQNYLGCPDSMPTMCYQLLLTDSCNMKCSYCYQGKKHANFMSIETTYSVIDKIRDFEKGDRKFIIQFFGGEPTLNPSVIEAAYHYAKKVLPSDWNYTFHLATNGYSIPEEFIKLMEAEPSKIMVTVSLDGNEQNHNKGRGHYKEVTDNLARYVYYLGKDNVKVGVTILANDPSQVYENFRHIIEDLKITNIKYNLELNNPDWLDDNNCKVFEEQLQLLTELLLHPKYVNDIYLGNLNFNFFKHAQDGVICKYSNTCLSFNWNGDIYSCTTTSSSIYNKHPKLVECSKFGNIITATKENVGAYQNSFSGQFNNINATVNTKNCSKCKINSGCKLCLAVLKQDEKGNYSILPYHCKIHKIEYKIFKYLVSEYTKRYKN